jgi:hypothetical protein
MKQIYLPKPTKIGLFFKIFLLQFALFFSSCENENYDSVNKNQSAKTEIQVKNGRLLFESKESFAKTYNEYVNLPEEKLNDLLMPLYKKGFLSLRPVVTEKNEETIFNLYKEKLKLQTPRGGITSKGSQTVPAPVDPILDDPLGPVEFIGDDTFAGFLNIDGEIQIGEEIYKYTDVGLFIAEESEYATLNDYLGSEDISTDPFVETELRIKEDVTLILPENYPTPIGVSNTIVYYRPSSTQSTTSSTTYSGPVAGSAAATDPTYNSFLSNLSTCDPHSGLFGNLFGDNDVCIDKYESKRRVKTKAFNYNYLLVYHMGVKCVHQFRGWTGFWRVEATDEIRLVVEAAQFEYDVDKLLGNTLINNNSQIKDFYFNDKRVSYGPLNFNVSGPFGFSYSNLSESTLPQIFQNSGLGLSFEWFGTGNTTLDNLVQNGINSNLNAKKINEHFYGFAYSQARDLLRQTPQNGSYTPPPNRTFAAKFPQNGKILIQKAVLDQGLNIGVREKTFDWGAEIRFNAKDSGDGKWNMTGGQGNLLARPKNFRVKIIGAARKGNQWHGSKFSVGID